MDFEQTITRSPKVISQEVAGETVLLDLESEHYFGLDPVGTRVWQLMGEPARLHDIFSSLLREYEVEETCLREDLTQLLRDIEKRGLATIQPAAEPGEGVTPDAD